MNDETGAQILTEGLPLSGLTFENKDERETIKVMVGSGTENHQTHNISKSSKVYFRQTGDNSNDIIEIEDGNATKPLVYVIQSATASDEDIKTAAAGTIF